MHPIGTDQIDSQEAASLRRTIVVGHLEDLPVGSRKTFELPDDREIALFNLDGEFYATDNSCPHKGAPLSEGILCGRVLECDWHGWQFDLRSGECLTVPERLQTYEVVLEDGLVKILI